MSNHFNPEKVVDFNVDYYNVLGLQKGCLPPGNSRSEREQITQILNVAYKKAAFGSHPDFAKNDEDRQMLNDKFKLVVRAHTILSNTLYRQYYESNGNIRPATVEQGSSLEVDWSKVGTYREGMLEDTIGNTIFLNITKKADNLNIVPAFKPFSEAHNFEWDWVIPDVELRPGEPTKLALSCVNDESDVLKLTSSNNLESSLPFKIYICIPRASLYFLRDEKQEYKLGSTDDAPVFTLQGGLKAALYSDINLFESTSLPETLEYISEGGKLEDDLKNLRNGSLMQKQKEFDIANNQSQWLSTEQVKKLDAEKLRSILISKTFFTEKNIKAAEVIDHLPDKVVRKKAKYQR